MDPRRSLRARMTLAVTGWVALMAVGLALWADRTPGSDRLAPAAAVLLAVLLTAGVSWWWSGRLLRPLRRLARTALRLAHSPEDTPDLAGLPLHREDELGLLVRAWTRAGTRLAQQIRQAAEERRRLMAVLDHLVDGVILVDGHGQVLAVNPAARRLLGHSGTDPLPTTLAQLVQDHRPVSLWEAAQQGSGVRTATWTLRGRVIRGMVIPFDQDQGPGGIVLLQDRTAQHQVEKVRRDFISNISHELRTPLASLQALVDTLREGALDDPQAARRFLDRMETEVADMSQMVQELLELSRIESGQVPMERRPIPVSQVVLPPVERLRAQAERAGVTLVLDLPGGLPRILADAERLQRVIGNLLHNAIKFTPAEGVITVRARAEEQGGQPWVVLQVTDTGVGIPAGDLPRIFERFYKADRARSRGGTGLGLAIAKHIVQAHGGTIWAESEEGRGSTFHVRIPAAR